jgi:hypothetical protein
MDAYGLTAEVIKAFASMIAAFAWPAAIFGIAWLFKEKLEMLLPLLQVKYKGLEVSLAQAEDSAAELPPATPDTEPKQADRTDFEKIVKRSPRSAILRVHNELVETIRSFARAVNLYDGNPQAYLKTLQGLRSNGFIDENTWTVLNDLLDIWNELTHTDSAPTEEEAWRFRVLANRVMRQIDIATIAAQTPLGPKQARR